MLIDSQGRKRNTLSSEYRKHLLSPEYQATREAILLRDEGRCRVCGSRENLCVHHTCSAARFHESEKPELLMVLCDRCHRTIHGYWNECDVLKEYYSEKRAEERRFRGL